MCRERWLRRTPDLFALNSHDRNAGRARSNVLREEELRVVAARQCVIDVHERCVEVLRAVSEARDDAGPHNFVLMAGPLEMAASGTAPSPHLAKYRRRAFWNYTVMVTVPQELEAGDVRVAPGKHRVPWRPTDVEDADLLIFAELADELGDALAELDALVRTEMDLRAERDEIREDAELLRDAHARAHTDELADRLLLNAPAQGPLADSERKRGGVHSVGVDASGESRGVVAKINAIAPFDSQTANVATRVVIWSFVGLVAIALWPITLIAWLVKYARDNPGKTWAPRPKTEEEKIEKQMRRASWMSFSHSKAIRDAGSVEAANATTKAILLAQKRAKEEQDS